LRLAGQHGNIAMTRYSIRKQGFEYVVLADDQCVLKVASRRRAAKLVVDAAELLSVQSALPLESSQDSDQSPVRDAKFLDDEGRFP
jgi:hypothetical protein